MTPPPTPLLAGSPVANSHLPESSYKPAMAITDKSDGTCFESMTCFPVGKRGRHDGKVPGVDANRTLSCIDVRCLLWILFDPAVGVHQFSDRLISLVRIRLGLVDLLIH